MPVTFNTNQLKSRRKAIIDGDEFTIRRMGNIERLEVLRKQEEVESILKKYKKGTPESEFAKDDLDKLKQNSVDVSEIIVSLFDDGTPEQAKSRKLVATLDEKDIIEIIESVFAQTDEKDSASTN